MLCGLVFIGIGAAALWIAQPYATGTPMRLGTGVFPRILGWGLIGIGTAVFAKALIAGGPPLTGWAWRPVIMITAGSVAFALLIEPAGLVAAMLALMGFGALGGDGHRARELVPFMLAMLAAGIGIFVYALGMPLRLFPWS